MMAMKWRIGLGLALVGGCLALAGLRNPALAEQEGLFLGTHGNEGTIGEVAPTPGKTAKERELERRLNVPITVDFADIALDHALDRIRQSSGLTIIVDRAALEEEGIDLQRPVTLNLEDVTVKSVLNVLLRSVHLTWVIQDEVVQVTTWKQSRGKLLQRTYSVADLVVPIPNFSTPFPEDATSGTAAPPSPPKTDEQRLIRLIVSTIEPSSWSEVGGRGTIEYFPLGMALVINQTADLHEQIAELLDALRRLQDVTVAVEMRLVSVPEAIAKRLRRQFGINWNTPKTGAGSDAGKVVFLSDIQLFMLMEAIQGDRRTSVLQAPKLTLFNGQNATIQSEDQKVYTTGVETKWDGERPRTTPRTEVVATGLRCSGSRFRGSAVRAASPPDAVLGTRSRRAESLGHDNPGRAEWRRRDKRAGSAGT